MIVPTPATIRLFMKDGPSFSHAPGNPPSPSAAGSAHIVCTDTSVEVFSPLMTIM